MSRKDRTIPFNIVVVEDNPGDVILLKELVARVEPGAFPYNCRFIYADSLEVAVKYLINHEVQLVILELFLTDSQGLSTLEAIREIAPEVPVIVLTVQNDSGTSIEAVKMGAQEYLVKTQLDANSLIKSIHHAVERQRLQLQLEKETRELQQRENQLMRVINGDPDGLIIVEAENDHVLFLNPAAEKLLGRESEQLMNKPFGFKVSVDMPMEIAVLKDSRDEKSQSIYADMRAVEIDWKGKKSWLISLRDMTAKKRFLEAYEEERERLEVTLRSIADGVIATDETGMVLIINWVASQMIGIPQEEAVARSLDDVLDMHNETDGKTFRFAELAAIPDHTLQQSSRIDDWIIVARDGSQLPVEYSCGLIHHYSRNQGCVLVIRDVSERKIMEEEATRVQNLEALGLLAGGIAHEYNNLLTSVIGFLSLARVHSEDDPRLQKRLRKAELAGLRAKEISGRLLTFSKGGVPRKKKAAIIKTLNDAVIDTIDDPSVTVSWQLEQLWPVVFDPDQIQLVLKNLLLNSLQAMPGGGTIRIKAENVNIPGDTPGDPNGIGVMPGDSARLPVIVKGRYVRLSIADEGEGIPRRNLGNVFTPYYSTRTKAEGMGLTTAYSIIIKHGGYISVKSRISEGSTFMIWLPALGGTTDDKRPAPRPPYKHKKNGSGEPGNDSADSRGKYVLVMDDEAFIRDIADAMLTELGHCCETAENGEEAIRLFRDAVTADKPFDVVILDLTVPSGMGGKECIEILTSIEPNIKAIVSSGYSNDPILAQPEEYGFSGVLPKPYELDELQRAIESVS